MQKEKTYRLVLTSKQLYILAEQMHAVADVGHRDRDELELLDLIDKLYSKSYADSKKSKKLF